MSVNVTWSLTSGGNAIAEPLDHGSGAAGSSLAAQTIFLSHDAVNPITGCVFYIEEKSGTYAGSFTPATDLAELLAWGDDTTEDGFGGIQLNLDADGSFPSESWPIYSSKERNSSQTFRTGVGDSPANGIPLPTTMGLDTAGTIPAGNTPGASFAIRVQIPTDEGTTGVREFDQKLRFTFTS